MKTINIKGKEYVPVNERIKYFRKEYPGYSLRTEVIQIDEDVAILKAVIRDNDSTIVAEGIAHEIAGDGFINKTSHVENCETSAWGRALGNLGIGIDTSIASSDEIHTAQRKSTVIDDPATTEQIEQIVELLRETGGTTNLDKISKSAAKVLIGQLKGKRKKISKELDTIASQKS